jgi:hypothetical protein
MRPDLVAGVTQQHMTNHPRSSIKEEGANDEVYRVVVGPAGKDEVPPPHQWRLL